MTALRLAHLIDNLDSPEVFMNTPKQLSRRHLLKIMGGAPMLPLATYSEWAQAAGKVSTPTAKLRNVSFKSMPAPSLANPAEMATMQVGSTLTANFSDGHAREFALSYQPFFISGDLVSDGQGGKFFLVVILISTTSPLLTAQSQEKNANIFQMGLTALRC